METLKQPTLPNRLALWRVSTGEILGWTLRCAGVGGRAGRISGLLMPSTGMAAGVWHSGLPLLGQWENEPTRSKASNA